MPRWRASLIHRRDIEMVVVITEVGHRREGFHPDLSDPPSLDHEAHQRVLDAAIESPQTIEWIPSLECVGSVEASHRHGCQLHSISVSLPKMAQMSRLNDQLRRQAPKRRRFFGCRCLHHAYFYDFSEPVNRQSDPLGSLNGLFFRGKLERAKGFEPSTPTLARLCSTPELRPLWRLPADGRQRVRQGR